MTVKKESRKKVEPSLEEKNRLIWTRLERR